MNLLDTMCRRHSNTWSVWTRLLSTPLAFVPIWNRSWRQGGAVAAWFAINPFLFPEPKNTEAWGPRAIRGERRRRHRNERLVPQPDGHDVWREFRCASREVVGPDHRGDGANV